MKRFVLVKNNVSHGGYLLEGAFAAEKELVPVDSLLKIFVYRGLDYPALAFDVAPPAGYKFKERRYIWAYKTEVERDQDFDKYVEILGAE